MLLDGNWNFSGRGTKSMCNDVITCRTAPLGRWGVHGLRCMGRLLMYLQAVQTQQTGTTRGALMECGVLSSCTGMISGFMWNTRPVFSSGTFLYRLRMRLGGRVLKAWAHGLLPRSFAKRHDGEVFRTHDMIGHGSKLVHDSTGMLLHIKTLALTHWALTLSGDQVGEPTHKVILLSCRANKLWVRVRIMPGHGSGMDNQVAKKLSGG